MQQREAPQLACSCKRTCKALKSPLCLQIFGGWILTIIIAALIAAGFCAFGVFTPNKFASASWT